MDTITLRRGQNPCTKTHTFLTPTVTTVSGNSFRLIDIKILWYASRIIVEEGEYCAYHFNENFFVFLALGTTVA